MRTTRRTSTIIIALLGAILMPAVVTAAAAEAHTATITPTCPTTSTAGTVTWDWESFPNHSWAYREIRIDDAVTVAKITPINHAATLTDEITVPQDGSPHEIRMVTRWEADHGGTATKTIGCVLPATPTPSPAPTPTPAPTPAPSPAPPGVENCRLGTACCPVCVTKRKRTIRLARMRISHRNDRTTHYRKPRGRPTFSVILPRQTVMQENLKRYGVAFDPRGERVELKAHRNRKGRWYVRVNQAGLLAVRGQYMNGTWNARVRIHGKLRTRHERRNWRLCMINDGDLDVPSNRLRD